MAITKNMNQPILIGMTGGIESTVAAYLLKKQGFRVIGIGLLLFDQDDDPGPFKEFAITDLSGVKEICDSLDIPFYAVNAKDEFQAFVSDNVIGRVLSGQNFEPIVFFNQMLIKVLRDKAEKRFQTKLVATGHYAKILKNQRSGVFELMVANDIQNDQSYELSALGKDDLENLQLPLAELQKTEVLKIYKLINAKKIERNKKSLFHVMSDNRLIPFVEKYSSKDLRRKGNIYNHYTEASICEHKGIHLYRVGMKNIQIHPEIKIDPELEVISIVPYKGNIFLEYGNKLKFKTIYLKNVLFSHHLDVSIPLSGFLKFSPKGEKYECKVYVKNNNHVLVVLEKEETGYLLVPGSYAVFYHRQHDKGKIFLSGMVELSGNFLEGDDYYTLPFSSSEEKHEEGILRKPVERLLF